MLSVIFNQQMMSYTDNETQYRENKCSSFMKLLFVIKITLIKLQFMKQILELDFNSTEIPEIPKRFVMSEKTVFLKCEIKFQILSTFFFASD